MDNMMKDYFVNIIKRYHKDCPDLIKVEFRNHFKLFYNSRNLNSFNEDELKEFVLSVSDKVAIESSPFTLRQVVDLLTFADLNTGAGGCAMTKYECKTCGEIDTWSNTATPSLCHLCLEKSAIKLMKSKYLNKLVDLVK